MRGQLASEVVHPIDDGDEVGHVTRDLAFEDGVVAQDGVFHLHVDVVVLPNN